MSEKESDDDFNTNSSEKNVIKEISDVLERYRRQELSRIFTDILKAKDISQTSLQVGKIRFCMHKTSSNRMATKNKHFFVNRHFQLN